MPLGQFTHLPVEAGHNGFVFLLRLFPFFPRLQGNEEKAAIGVGDAAQHVHAHHGGDVLHPRGVGHDLLDLAADFAGALQGGSVGQLHPGIHISLVLFREETAGQSPSQKAGESRHQNQKEEAHPRLPDKSPAPTDIAVGGAAEDIIEPAVEAAKRAPGFLFRLEEHGRQGWGQSQSVEGGNDDGDGDGDGKLLIKPAGDAGNEDGGNEDRGQRQGRGHHRPGDLLHGLQGGLFGRHALPDVMLHGLHHHDGVVHHDADGQDQPHQGNGIEGEAQEGEKAKVPMRETGTASAGMRVVRQPWRKMKTTRMTRMRAS